MPKFPEPVETDPEDSDTKDKLRAKGFPINKSLSVDKEQGRPLLNRGKNIIYCKI